MQFILLTGADIGSREVALEKAKLLIGEQVGTIIKCSGVFESAPWGFDADTVFLNQAILVESKLSPEELLCATQTIEMQLGRTKTKEQWSSRTIDVDILCGETIIHRTDKLFIPHRMLHERLFALKPLCELRPDWKHPLLKKSYRQLASDLLENDQEQLNDV